MPDLKTFRAITLQQLRDAPWIVDAAVFLLSLWGTALAVAGRRSGAIAALAKAHRATRHASIKRAVERYITSKGAAFERVPAVCATSEALFSGNRLIALKPPLANGERGVLLAMFTETLQQLYAGFNLEALMRDYTLVFEPSYPGYCHPGLLQYTRFPDHIFVLAPVPGDFRFLRALKSNLVPVELGPCDWVDPRIPEPYLHCEKEYDIVMNAIWASLKRHYVLFRMLANARRPYKVALIGTGWAGRDRYDVEREARYYGVIDRLTFFDSIPYRQAIEVTCKSRVSVLLSLKEAGPRAIAESIFCDVPVVVLRRLVGGIVKNIVPETGILTDERDLNYAVERTMQGGIRPREWGLQHISCLRSTERLNSVLRQDALSQGRPWSADIVVRSNSPECRYFFNADEERLRAWNTGLKDYIRKA